MRNRTLFLVAALVSPCRAPPPSPVPTAGDRAGSVWQFTYLKAMPGQRERLAAFIERNWFAMDARPSGWLPRRQPALHRTPADTSWNLRAVSIYADSLQHARLDSLFRRPTDLRIEGQRQQASAAGRRPAHPVVSVAVRTVPESSPSSSRICSRCICTSSAHCDSRSRSSFSCNSRISSSAFRFTP